MFNNSANAITHNVAENDITMLFTGTNIPAGSPGLLFQNAANNKVVLIDNAIGNTSGEDTYFINTYFDSDSIISYYENNQ